MTDKAYHIRERFSDKRHRIDFLMAQDSEFFDLCEDYDACVDALRYWKQSGEPEAETRIDEYSIIIEELEEEIARALEVSKASRVD